jgi:nitrogen regulation protein
VTAVGEIWVVDDDHSIRWVLERALVRAGFGVRTFAQVDEVLAALAVSEPAVLVSDIRMPGASGIELLYQVRQRRPTLPVIIMTAYSDLDSAVSAFQAGAFEYLPKPFDLMQAVALVQRAAQGRAEAARGAASARPSGRGVGAGAHSDPERGAKAQATQFPQAGARMSDAGLLGQAPAMQAVYRAIGRLARSDATVLLTGQSGTGKERVARALHQHSVRAERPFVAINMAAIPRDLMESELFGHERGAFTGAQTLRRGRFEQAEGGTLFLDEIGDMPAEMQTRLLRVLSEGHFYRVGGNQPVQSRVRVIAATHQDLEARVAQGLFRDDLFHRLNVIRLRLPPLAERVEDIPLLAEHFLAESAASLGVEPKQLGADALRVLCAFGWPGNVRQLENVCQWLTVMTAAHVVTMADLPPEMLPSRGAAATARPVMEAASVAAPQASGTPSAPTDAPDQADIDRETAGPEGWCEVLAKLARQQLEDPQARNLLAPLQASFERTLIEAALEATGGHRGEAARRLGLGRNTLARKIRDLGID